jgi:hypothetical protein
MDSREQSKSIRLGGVTVGAARIMGAQQRNTARFRQVCGLVASVRFASQFDEERLDLDL